VAYAQGNEGITVTGEVVKTGTESTPATAGDSTGSSTTTTGDTVASEETGDSTTTGTGTGTATTNTTLAETEEAVTGTAPLTNDTVKIRLNFQDQDIRNILLYLSDITGETILPENNIKGNITVINPKAVTPEEAKQIIFSILEMSGYTIVPYEHLTKVVKSGDAKTRPIKTLQPPESVQDMDTEDVIRSQVIYPENISAAQVQKFIKPLVTKGAGDVIIDERTGAVIIIDTGANIKRLMEIIDIIDKVVEGGQIDVRIIPMKYADETEMRQVLETIFNAPALKDPAAQSVTFKGSAGETSRSTPPTTSARRRQRTPTTPTAPSGDTSLRISNIKSTVTFIADPRLHALIVVGAERNFPLIQTIIDRLDVPTTESDDTVHIYPLQHAEVVEIAATLNNIFAEAGATRSVGGTTRSTTSRDTRSQTSTGRTTRDSRYSRSQPPTSRRTTSRGTTLSVKATGLTHLAGKVEVLPDEPSNSLIIITSPRYYEAVKRLIKKLDQRTPQVFIEALIVEVTRTKDFNLGIGWKKILDHKGSWASPIQVLDTTLGPVIDETKKEIVPASVDGISYAFGKFSDDGSFDPYFTLQTAEGVRDINVLSAPSVLASNNKVANIRVGQQFPIARYSRGTSGETRDFTYDYVDIDIELDVTPRINRHREVALIVSITVKEDGGTAYPNDPNAPPIILNRAVNDEVVVQDGRTLVIGGLIKDDFKTREARVPLVGNIPIIKHAFRSTEQEKNKTELLVFITPRVVVDMYEGDTLTEETREKYRGANAFVMSRDRRLLYDDVNYAKTQLTIYDDWRDFEKDVEYFETYFRGFEEEEQVLVKPRWFPKITEEPKKDEPYEGEILKLNETGVQFEEKKQPKVIEDEFGAGDLPETIDRDVDMSQYDKIIYDRDDKGTKNDFDAGDLPDTIDKPANMQQKDDIIYNWNESGSGTDSTSHDAQDDYIMSELPALLARERLLVEQTGK
jgi:general secretion pathway protein D